MNVPCFVVTAGQIEIVRSSGEAETLVAVHAPGQFTGEVNMISARPALFRVRARESGEAIELSREQMVALVQTDGGLGEIPRARLLSPSFIRFSASSGFSPRY